MIKGLYTAASGMINLLSANDNIANNLANINTPGFKQGITLFKNFAPLLIKKISAEGDPNAKSGLNIGSLNPGCTLSSIVTDFTQGEVKKTDNNYDLAIYGNGFFEVETPDGKKMYTRDGSFQRSAEGYLTTRDGNKLVGKDNKPIKLAENALDFMIKADGTVMVNNQPVNKVKVVEFENKYGLMKRGNNLFEDIGMAQPKLTSSSRIIQGALEASNANVIKTMVNSIDGMRTYETLARIVDNVGKNLEKTANQLGKY